MKRFKHIFNKLKAEKKSTNEAEKALACADDDGFALPEKKRSKNNHEKED